MANATPFYTRSPKTIVVYPINGQTEFTIPFEFLARKFVVVTLLGVDRLPLVLNTDYRFVSVNRIQLLSPVPAGYPNIELRRLTSATDRLVDFHDGSILRAYDLNLAQIQTMHVAEEARDLTADNIGVNDNGDLDARNRKIVNLADGTENNDAVNLGQLRQFDTSTANNADRAEAAKNRAVQAETNTARDSASAAVNATKAVASAGTAVQAASDANRSYEKIVPLEQSTVANAQVATQQAQRAQNEADRAKSEADKLANINDFAGTLHGVSGSRIPEFKDSIGLGLENDHSYVGFFSKLSNEPSATRKGYVGLGTPNNQDMQVTAEKGYLTLSAAYGTGSRIGLRDNMVQVDAERLLLNGNASYIDAADKTTGYFSRIYTGNGRFAITNNLSATGAWLRDIISAYQHPSDASRGTIDFGKGNIQSQVSGSSWAGSTDPYNAALSSKSMNNAYITGTAYAAAALRLPPNPTVGWPTGMGVGVLTNSESRLDDPAIWAHGLDNATTRSWVFETTTGRIKFGSETGFNPASVLNTDLNPQGAPVGQVTNPLGMIQWRYGAAIPTPQIWTWVPFHTPFPTGVLAIIVTSLNVTTAAWPHRVGSWNNTGFNVTGGINEQAINYIALGY